MVTRHRPTRVLARRRAAVAAVALLLPLAGCASGDDPAAGAGDDSTPRAGDTHDLEDVEFATAMIPHHALALAMVDVAAGRRLSPEATAMAEAIGAARPLEIEQMSDWLQEWGEPVPETVRDHANAGHGGRDEAHDTPDLPGSEVLAALEEAADAQFEELWLTSMVEHHRDAVTMAETEIEEGSFPAAVALAREIVASQEAEAEQLERLLGQ